MSDDRLTPQDAGRILDRIEASPESLSRWRKTIMAVLRADPHPKRQADRADRGDVHL